MISFSVNVSRQPIQLSKTYPNPIWIGQTFVPSWYDLSYPTCPFIKYTKIMIWWLMSPYTIFILYYFGGQFG